MNELLNNPEVLRQLIMDHYQHPHNHGLVEDEAYHNIHMASASCIDDLHLQMKVEASQVVDVRFEGIACTISTASTSIIGDLIKGKTVEEAEHIIAEYNKMINQEAFDEDLLEEAYAFHTVGKQANRIKCALIGIDGFSKLLAGENNE